MLDLNLIGVPMVGITVIKEIEDLLLDKLDKQETCLNFYNQVDDTIRQDMLLQIFQRIDGLEHDIHMMDILFITKFEKFKKLNGIKDIDALNADEQQSFKLIRKAVVQVAERERSLVMAKNETQDIRLKTEMQIKKTSRISKAHSAYKNINK